ncbi:hypothetical protein AVEN_128989-1 [Araneus ventricosus]|uniref:Uncharacterized protein n=1 Tax=Araneus ventricosus TaxID=182803 RepID=A0A4Y2GED7_ARAVE|nr:hypothetical protein AVEN_128989-1 [Araneus ventricosus]
MISALCHGAGEVLTIDVFGILVFSKAHITHCLTPLSGVTSSKSCSLGIRCSDVSFTQERIRGSGSSKGTTGSDSVQKERMCGIGFLNLRNWICELESDLLIPQY